MAENLIPADLIPEEAVDSDFMKQIIASLKMVKDSKNLSVTEIEEMVNRTGEHVSKSTLYRIFSDDAENDSFSYNQSLRPVARALLVYNENAADAMVRAQLDTYLHICQYKMEVIDSLRRQIERLKDELLAKSEDYNRRVAFLRDQIELKDQRMDRKDEMIDRLLSELLKLKKE